MTLEINNNILTDCKLEGDSHITLPEGITEISALAFSGCATLESIDIPGSVEYIGEYAFENCSSLKQITLPDKITKISAGMFTGCSSLEAVKLPVSLKKIGGLAFEGCVKLKDITLPDSLTEIHDCAFKGCTSLTKLSLPEGLTRLGVKSFCECINLAEITIPSTLNKISSGAFSACRSLTALAIPEGVTFIGCNSFEGCINIRSIILPGTLQVMEEHAFHSCTRLKELIFNGAPKIIPSCCFISCNSLEEVYLPQGLTQIGNNAFFCCENLRKVVFPDSLKQIDFKAFAYCKKLSELIGAEHLTDIKVDIEAFLLTPWEASNDICMLGDCLYKYNRPDEHVVIPEGVRSISPNAFHENKSMASVCIPSYVDTIYGHAFEKCEALRTITLGASEVKMSAFTDCTQISEIYIDSTVKRIQVLAFSHIDNITYVEYQHSDMEKLPQYDFYSSLGFETHLTPVATPNISLANSLVIPRNFTRCMMLGAMRMYYENRLSQETVKENNEYMLDNKKLLLSIADKGDMVIKYMFEHRLIDTQEINTLMDQFSNNTTITALILELKRKYDTDSDTDYSL